MQPMMTLRNRGEVRWEWIGEGWKYFTQNPGSWVAMMLMTFVISILTIAVPIMIFLVPAISVASNGSSPLGGAALGVGMVVAFLGILVIGIVVSAFLVAGLFKAAIKQTQGEAISPGSLFLGRESFVGVLGLFGLMGLAYCVLFIAILMVSAISSELASLFSLFQSLFGVIAMGFLFYTVPLIVDRKAGVIDAIRTSISTTLPHWYMYIFFAFVLNLISSAGAILCFVGMLATTPVALLAAAKAYRDTFAGQDVPDYDHFGAPPPPAVYQASPSSNYPVAPEYPAAPPRPQFSSPSPQFAEPVKPQYPNPAPQFPEPPKPQYPDPAPPPLPAPPVPPYAQETQLFEKECPGCGAVLQRAANFCNQCGHRIQPG